MVIVKPEAVIAGHRKGFRLFGTGKSRRGQPGRPAVLKDVRDLIRRMSRENPMWGAPRIHGELRRLGIEIGETSVGKYMLRHRKPPSQTWRTFLDNHVQSLVSAHDRRRIMHFNVTAQPTAEWTAQQLQEAFPFDQIPRYLLRDRDGIFGQDFRKQVEDMGIKEVLSAPRSPWQRAYVERVIGTIRRECLAHMIVSNENSLYRHMKSFVAHYHRWRTQLSLGEHTSESRPGLPPEVEPVVALQEVSGLHHCCERRAA